MSVFDEPSYADIETWVANLQREFRRTGPSGVADLSQAAPHPTENLVAVTAALRPEPDDDLVRQVLLVGGSEEPRPVLGGEPATTPVWSPNGDLLCVLGATAVLVDRDGGEARRAPWLGGTPEAVRWSPDGTRLALVVAEPGAEVSDVWGSGTVGGATEQWRPQVAPASGGRRRLVVWQTTGDPARALVDDLTGLNVWEADWLGEDLVALVSEGAGEGAWYDARLVTVSLDGRVAPLHEERYQLARPAGAPDGARWSALGGLASDRDLLAGSLLVGPAGGAGSVVPTAEVHVTDHRWTSAEEVLVIGHRGLDTVVGTVDVTTGAWAERWSDRATTGTYQPDLGGVDRDGRLVLVVEQHDLPPTLTRLDGTVREVLLDGAGPGTAAVLAAVGETRSISWTARDGLVIQGLLDLPRGAGPHPLVVHPHGGPVGAYQDGWIGRDPHTTVLVARGYAVLRPNPRGSAGRGADFAEAVVGDMGGEDVHDILAGIDRLVADRIADPDRLGLVGQSYAGFLACWMPCLDDRFRASVSRSPCTEWVSFHRTTNIPEFDDLFLAGDLSDPGSQYQTRNPVTHHATNATPTFLTAGVLDLATPASQAQQMYAAPAARGVESALAIYPEEGHGVQAPPALADQCARIVAWFERFMPVGG